MARLEVIRILLAFAVSQSVKLFHMDVKSAFLNRFIKEEVYVEQPLGFKDHKYPDHVFKLNKVMYRLKQAPRKLEYYLHLLSHNLLSYFRCMSRVPSSIATSKKKFMWSSHQDLKIISILTMCSSSPKLFTD